MNTTWALQDEPTQLDVIMEESKTYTENWFYGHVDSAAIFYSGSVSYTSAEPLDTKEVLEKILESVRGNLIEGDEENGDMIVLSETERFVFIGKWLRVSEI